MLDRALAVIGLAVTIILGLWSVAPATWPKLPGWVTLAGVGCGLLVLGTGGGLLLANSQADKNPVYVDSAELKLHVYNDDRLPSRLSFSNVWRWYYLRALVLGGDKDSGSQQKGILTTLFINFDTPVKVGTLEISSPDMRLPFHEVKDFNPRFAIIVFSGELPEGTLQINVHQ